MLGQRRGSCWHGLQGNPFLLDPNNCDMAQKKQTTSSSVGPMLWVCYLMHRFNCEHQALSYQLAQPTEDGEAFVWARVPFPDESIPDMFGRIYELGTNPDGAYFTEPNSPGKKFNLFSRVLERVPESRHWLLRQASGYFEEAANVAESLALTRDLLSHSGWLLLSAECVHAWTEFDPVAAAAAGQQTLDKLSEMPRPEALLLLLALLHQAVWHFSTHTRNADLSNSSLIHTLSESCIGAAKSIGALEWVASHPAQPRLAHNLHNGVRAAVQHLCRHGQRELYFAAGNTRFPTHIVLVADTDASRSCMRAMQAHSSLYGFEAMFDERRFHEEYLSAKDAHVALSRHVSDFLPVASN